MHKDFEKQTCRQLSDHFIYSTPALSVLFFSIIAWSVLMALVSISLQRYVRKGNDAKNPAIFRFCLLPFSSPKAALQRIATSGHVQHRKSAINGLPITLRMFRVKSDKSDWFWSKSIVFSKPFENGMSLDRARGRDSWC